MIRFAVVGGSTAHCRGRAGVVLVGLSELGACHFQLRNRRIPEFSPTLTITEGDLSGRCVSPVVGDA
jgi:hypothetical protein